MTTPLIEALVSRHGFAVVDETSVDAFLGAHEHSLLFFPGDAERLVESNDVAVVLPEILKVYGPRLAPALVAKSAERTLQRRFRFNAFPSIVFMRRDGYLGVLSRVLNWSDYLAEIGALLASEVSEPPPFRFPDGCYSAGMPHEADHSAQGDFQ
ncbi:MAG: hydrogenase-1 expression HyaE [Hyphomicrobium sp.]|jgi:hydrogenase-1 operon protein HyaE